MRQHRKICILRSCSALSSSSTRGDKCGNATLDVDFNVGLSTRSGASSFNLRLRVADKLFSRFANSISSKSLFSLGLLLFVVLLLLVPTRSRITLFYDSFIFPDGQMYVFPHVSGQNKFTFSSAHMEALISLHV